MKSKDVAQVFCTVKLGTETGTCWLSTATGIQKVDVTKVTIPVKTWKTDDEHRKMTYLMTGFEKLKCSMDMDTTTWEETNLSCKDTGKS